MQKTIYIKTHILDSLFNNHTFLKKAFVFFLSLFSFQIFSQAIIVPAAFTACPNQIVTVTPTWNNVGSVTYSLASPVGGSPSSGVLGPVASFTISHTNTVTSSPVFTLIGSGTAGSGPVTSTVFFNLNIIPPAPLTLTNQIFYCPGNSATITAPIGGNSYNINGPGSIQNNLPSNIITIPNLPSTGANGVYTITSVGACTVTGTTSISVAPSTPLAINASSNICQCLGNGPASVVSLTSALAGGQNFQWYSPINQALGTFSVLGSSTCNVSCPQPTDAGVYTAYAELPWGAVNCPRTATTMVNVVSTSPVGVSASPGNFLCQGDKLSFSAVAGGAIGWTWAGPQSFAASIPNPTINPVGLANTGNYTVTALFTNNVITCSTKNTVSVTIIGVSQPVISMPTSVCEGATNVILSAFSPNATYYTCFGPNSFSPTINTPTVNAPIPGPISGSSITTNASGVYYVTAFFGNPSTATCAASNSVQLNVVPVNTISVIPPTPVCQPNNGNLQCSAIGASSYTWSGPGGFIAPGPNATVYYPTPSSSGIYTVLAAFSGGNLTCFKSNTVQLVVNPILTFSLIPRQQVCYNTPLGVTGPPGATSYSWTSSTGYSSTNKDLNFPSVQPNNSGTYTLQVYLGPCPTSASTTIDVLTPVSFTLMPQNREICKGDTTVLEAGVTGGSQNYAYIWNPSVYMETPIGPKKIAVPLSTVIYNVIAHDIACPNYTIAHSFSISVNQPPVPTLSVNQTSGCTPLSVNFDPQFPTGGSAITTYDFGGLSKYQASDNTGRFSKEFITPGTYSLVIYTKGANGCGGAFPQPYPIEVFPKPGTSISWDPPLPTTTDEVVFSFGTADNTPLIYKGWNFNGGSYTVIDTAIKPINGIDTSDLDRPVRIYPSIGKFPVSITTTNDKGCSETVFKFITITDDFKIFIPNSFTPNGDGLNDSFGVKGSGIKMEGFTFEITDRWGDVLFSTKDITEWWDGKYNGNFVKAGTYVYRVKAVGLNGEGRKEIVNYFNVIR